MYFLAPLNFRSFRTGRILCKVTFWLEAFGILPKKHVQSVQSAGRFLFSMHVTLSFAATPVPLGCKKHFLYKLINWHGLLIQANNKHVKLHAIPCVLVLPGLRKLVTPSHRVKNKTCPRKLNRKLLLSKSTFSKSVLL